MQDGLLYRIGTFRKHFVQMNEDQRIFLVIQYTVVFPLMNKGLDDLRAVFVGNRLT